MTSERYLADLRAQYAEQALARMDEYMAVCDSPIEQIALAAFIVGWGFMLGTDSQLTDIANVAICCGISRYRLGLISCPRDDARTFLFVQADVAKESRVYRLDFAYSPGPDRKLALELDGDDYHERTADQAERDKSRDRRLQRAGWQVLRFTGREVCRDPNLLLDELAKHLIAAPEGHGKSMSLDEALALSSLGSPP